MLQYVKTPIIGVTAIVQQTANIFTWKRLKIKWNWKNTKEQRKTS